MRHGSHRPDRLLSRVFAILPRRVVRVVAAAQRPRPGRGWARSSAALWMLGTLLFVGCAGVQEGESCNSERFACADVDAALECREERWVRIPCRGPAGCEEAGDQVRCDLSANRTGDLCPLNAYGQGRCADGGEALLECRQGQMVQTRSCSACEAADGILVCTPP